MRSIEFKLDQEHRARLSDCLRKDTIQLGPEAEAAFAANIEASIDVFQELKSILEITHRRKHEALRAAWKLVWEDDVSPGQLRARLCGLPKQVTEFLQARARQMIPELADVAGYDFSQWVRDADPENLKNVVRLISADGAKSVTRSRGPGKRSSARLEPLIFGNARDATEEAPEGGRPRHDARDALVMYLAIDWSLASGAKPSPGRSDHTGFGDLVHCVFQWIDEPSPDQALRRYWEKVKAEQSFPA
jgi:hypothetical protein